MAESVDAQNKTVSPKRAIVRLVLEICQERDIQVQRLSADWILRLTRASSSGREIRHIQGFVFDLNRSGSSMITKDKCSTSAVLLAAGVPHIEHEMFIHPETREYHSDAGNWTKLSERLKARGRLALKPNDGSGGNGLFLVRTPRELEEAVQKLFALGRNIAVCPFYEIETEYRCFVLNGEARLCFAKKRPTVIGDGERSLLELIAAADRLSDKPGRLGKRFEQFDRQDWNALSAIPAVDEVVRVGWKHNLGAGAAVDMNVSEDVKALAERAAEETGLVFGAVDVVDCGDAGLRVMEINASAMLENFCRVSSEHESMARELYADALAVMFPDE